MKPVRPGDRGPAVEDIQRRLVALGFDIGRSGIDGVFAGATAEGVAAFQANNGLKEDGWVGDITWAALVDATFTLGDRMLYLRLPHFHGHDAYVLQEALNVLGFACGEPDGIFGAFTERAVKEFQRNVGLVADGIVGPETVRALGGLRHVWEGKSPKAHSGAKVALARKAEVLGKLRFAVGGLDDRGHGIAGRVVNLAQATSEQARVVLIPQGEDAPAGTQFALRISCGGTESAYLGSPLVRAGGGDLLATRLVTALSTESSEVIVEFDDSLCEGEREEQHAAVALLDAVCLAFE
jgi:hypothetical protein